VFHTFHNIKSFPQVFIFKNIIRKRERERERERKREWLVDVRKVERIFMLKSNDLSRKRHLHNPVKDFDGLAV